MDGERERLLGALPALLRELAASGVTELDVTAGTSRLFIRQRPGLLPPLEDAAGDGADGAGTIDEGLVAVTAPLAGVFYAAPSPEEPPYATAGDAVEAGQVVALVEAMKVFNEIHAEVAGTVVAVLFTSGQPVRAGQALLTMRPDADAPIPEPAPETA